MKKLLLAALAIASIAAPLAASAAGLSGVWTINGAFDVIGKKYTVVCTLAQSGGAISGPCKDPDAGTMAATGTATATSIDLGYDTTYQGVPLHLEYKGDLLPDGSLKGTIDTVGGQGTFTATRG